MMHDADDTTLMAALRDADPLNGSTPDEHARHRLERSWHEAVAQPAEDGAPRRRTIGARGRGLQPVAAAIMALVLLAGGVLVSKVVAQRDDGTGAATQQAGDPPGAGVGDVEADRPDAGPVAGSYRAVQRHGDHPADTFLVAGGRALVRGGAPEQDTTPDGYFLLAEWRNGFDEFTNVSIDEQAFAGDELYLRARTEGQEQAHWYRYTGSRAPFPAGLAETPPPVFEERTRGFERVTDEQAEEQGLRRYTADADNADLEFLGWFAPTYGTSEPTVTTVDIWVDTEGRVRRLEELTRTEPAWPSVTRFDRFDAVDPIILPFAEPGDVPVVDDMAGLILTACGDAAFDDALRERVTAELEGDADVADFELRTARGQQDDGPPLLEDQLFDVHVRFADRIEDDVDALEGKAQRLASITAGDVPETDSADRRGYASMCSNELLPLITLDG